MSQSSSPTTDYNTYLRRTCSDAPRTYSYDLQQGKYSLQDSKGAKQSVSKIGTYPSRFVHGLSGKGNAKDRKRMSMDDPSLLHYAPETTTDYKPSFSNTLLYKFAGYAQFPYQLNGLPQHLKPSKQRAEKSSRAKSYHQELSSEKKSVQKIKFKDSGKSSSFTSGTDIAKNLKKVEPRSVSVILQQTAMTFTMNPQLSKTHFNTSFNAMSCTKPLPRFAKRTCYNYKCKNLQQFSFDQKSKIQAEVTEQYSDIVANSFVEKTKKLLNLTHGWNRPVSRTKALDTKGLTVNLSDCTGSKGNRSFSTKAATTSTGLGMGGSLMNRSFHESSIKQDAQERKMVSQLQSSMKEL